MDVLSQVITAARVGAVVVARAELVPPWALEVDPVAEVHVHVVQRGSCWLRTSEEPAPRRLHAGDVVLIRSGVGHTLADDPGTPPAPYREVLAAMPTRLARFPAHRSGEICAVLCAKYLFEPHGFHPLTALLPPLIHLTASEAARDEDLSLLLQLLRREAEQGLCGAELVLPRLTDSLLVYVLRSWLAGQPSRAGLFTALREPAIANALALIHEEPARPWTVESLAERVAQSRATFARRFHALAGEPPRAYLTRWRMCLAAKLLTESTLGLEQIAERVGYESAAAFAKAFRRSHSVPPGEFRSKARATRNALPT